MEVPHREAFRGWRQVGGCLMATLNVWGSVNDGELTLLGQREVPQGTQNPMGEFIQALRDVANEFDTLHQFDEIVSGMGGASDGGS